MALTLDPLYTKAYLRRASARMGLKKYIEAKADFEKVLQLEPQNKKARSDIEQIEKVFFAICTDTGHSFRQIRQMKESYINSP